jgi:hypothetical protein
LSDLLNRIRLASVALYEQISLQFFSYSGSRRGSRGNLQRKGT